MLGFQRLQAFVGWGGFVLEAGGIGLVRWGAWHVE